MTCLGLDIGGANLKAADGRGWAKSVSFPLWRDPHGLAGALDALVQNAPVSERLAVTMTGELCDCFSSKIEGVRHILAAVDQLAAGGRKLRSISSMGGLSRWPRRWPRHNWRRQATGTRWLASRAGS